MGMHTSPLERAGTHPQTHIHTNTKKGNALCGAFFAREPCLVYFVVVVVVLRIFYVIRILLIVNLEFILQLSSWRCWTFVIKSCYLSAVYKGD